MENKKILSLAMMGLIGATGYGLFWLGMKQGMEMAAPLSSAALPSAENPQKSGSSDKRVLYWHDPMVPGQKFDKSGKSPFMDMQLVPVYASDTGDDGTVSISPRLQQNLGIRTAEVTTGSLASTVVAVGNVVYNERDVELVQARSNGYVERLYVRAPLDLVHKDQPLAELYVPDWVAAQEEYLSVKRMQDGPGLGELLAGARQRMRLAGMTEDQIHRVESSDVVQKRLTIRAPITGIVSELVVREGMTVMAGASLFRINGISTIWVNADVPESVSAQVRPGNAVEARTPSLPGIVFKGKISTILPEINAATRTLKVRIELANPSGQLIPGMFATITFVSIDRKDVLLVPTEAIIHTGTRSVVMVAQGEDKFVSANVETAAEANGQTEILSGLESGQKVVVSGQFLIDSEASLKGTTMRMSDQPALEDAKTVELFHHGDGTVEAIGKNEITLSHGPIPSLQWGPMTMGFQLPATGLPPNIMVGDHVVFEIRQVKEGVFEIASILSSPAKAAQKSKSQAINDGMKAHGKPAGAEK